MNLKLGWNKYLFVFWLLIENNVYLCFNEKKLIMRTFTNLNIEKIETVFSMTGFNYDITTSSNEDGTENVEFDSDKDAEKFETLYNEL